MSLHNLQWKILDTIHEDLREDLLAKRPALGGKLESHFTDLYDPFLLSNMPAVIERIKQAIQNREHILIHGDYDVDGIVSTTLLYEALQKIIQSQYPKLPLAEYPLSYFLPHRIDDGYGLNAKNLPRFREQGIDLIITVDNGITAVEEIAQAHELGMEVIVTDHHTPLDTLPDCLIINPKLPGDKYPFDGLCGAAVAYKLIQALATVYPESLSEHYRKWLFELVALATVVDCMEIIDENRTFVQLGLKALRRSSRPGLQALFAVAGIDPQTISAGTLGFQIGPRLNAAGRIDAPDIGFRLLLSDDTVDAQNLAQELDSLNQSRRELLDISIEQAEQTALIHDQIIIAYQTDWHVGVIGLIAGRLAEKYHRPVFAMTDNDDSIVGSIRNPLSRIHIVEALETQQQYLKHFGGHAQAAGFSLIPDQREAFQANCIAWAEQHIHPQDLQRTLTADRQITLAEIDTSLLDMLSQFRPFGIGNSEARFYIHNVEITSVQTLGSQRQHLKCTITDGQYSLVAVAWNQAHWSDSLNIGQHIDAIGKLRLNTWNGKSTVQMVIEDVRKSEICNQ